MLSYNEFKDYLCKNVKKYLPEQFQNAAIKIEKYTKANAGEIEAIMIVPEGGNIAPAFPLNDFYKGYQDGESLEEIMEDIRKGLQINAEKILEPSDLEQLDKWDYWKDKISIRVVNKDRNRLLMEQVPWRDVEGTDLIMFFDIRLSNEAHILIQNERMDQWAVGKEELYNSAMSNLQKEQVICSEMTGKFLRMPDGKVDLVDAKLTDVEQPEMLHADFLYRVTNENGIFGAAELLNKELLSELEKRLQGELVIFPSSVHELVLSRYNAAKSPAALQCMVLDGNRFLEKEQDFLSNNVYVYGNGKIRTITNENTLMLATQVLEILNHGEQEDEKGMEQ